MGIRVENPIISGFHPDPSILRVGSTFYIANSTFEWFPGVEIWQSKNLSDWRFCTRPLTRLTQLDMRGIPSSGGIWAPCLSYADDQFWLIYTIVRHWKIEGERDGGAAHFKDTPNFLVTAPRIEGPWSDPIALNSSGFDASLFHDHDRRKWLLNMKWDWRPGHNPFAGILLQEYDHSAQKLIGPIKNIFKGTDLAITEGPHLHKKDGLYWLVVAEGGTSYQHATVVARSEKIDGVYEADPSGPLSTAIADRAASARIERHWQQKKIDIDPAMVPSDFYDIPQKTGHGSLCHVTGDEWALAHLMGRPLRGTTHCPLGRETGLQPVVWPPGEWPRLKHGSVRRVVEFSDLASEGANASGADTDGGGADAGGAHIDGADADGGMGAGGAHIDGADAGGTDIDGADADESARADGADNSGAQSFREQFAGPDAISNRWQSLRVPMSEFVDLRARPGWLRLIGKESPQSRFTQALLACRVTATNIVAETEYEFAPRTMQQQAGLLLRYDEQNQLCCGFYYDEEQDDYLIGVSAFIGGKLDAQYTSLPKQSATAPLTLQLRVAERTVRFFWKAGGAPATNYQQCGGAYDSATLSDEYAIPMGFTGQFVGIYCVDTSGQNTYADFNYFDYKENIKDE